MLFNVFFWCIKSINKVIIKYISNIKGWKLHQMQNNIRYEGDTNNASVIIFFLYQKSKTPSDGTLLGRISEAVFVSLFHFCMFISFLIFIFLLLFSICRCSSFICFLTSSLTFPWTIAILYFQPSPSQSDLRHFHFQPFRYLLTTSAAVLSGLTGVFYVTLLHQHFWLNLRLSRPPWEQAVHPWSL